MNRESDPTEGCNICLRCTLFAVGGSVFVATGCLLALCPALSPMVDDWLMRNAWRIRPGMLVLWNMLSGIKAGPLVLCGLSFLALGAASIVTSCLIAFRRTGARRPLVLTARILLACAMMLAAVASFLS